MYGVLKRKLALLVSLVFVLGTFGVPAYAKSGEEAAADAYSASNTKSAVQLTKLCVGGQEMDLTTASYWNMELTTGSTWNLDLTEGTDTDYDFKFENNELYLNLDKDDILIGNADDAAHYGAAIYAKGDLTIILEDDGEVQGVAASGINSTGICVIDGNLTLKGNHTLTAAGGEAKGDNAVSAGIYVYSENGDVSVIVTDNCKLIAHGDSSTENKDFFGINFSAGVYAVSKSGNVSVTADNGSIDCTSTYGVNCESDGIYSISWDGNVDVTVRNNGEINAKAEDVCIFVRCNYGTASVNVLDNSTIKVENETYGLYVSGFNDAYSSLYVGKDSKIEVVGTQNSQEDGIGVFLSTPHKSTKMTVAENGEIVTKDCQDGILMEGAYYDKGDVALEVKDGGKIEVNESENGISLYGFYDFLSVSVLDNGSININDCDTGVYIHNGYGESLLTAGKNGKIEIKNSTCGIQMESYYNKGSVTADGGSITSNAEEIGINFINGSYTITTKNGGTVDFKGTKEINTTNSVVYKNDGEPSVIEGSIYENSCEYDGDMEIPQGYKLNIKNGQTLHISEYSKLEVNGTLVNNGTLKIDNSSLLLGDGTLEGDGKFLIDKAFPIVKAPEKLTYTGSDLTGNIKITEPAESYEILGKTFEVSNLVTSDMLERKIYKDNRYQEVENIIGVGIYEIVYSYYYDNDSGTLTTIKFDPIYITVEAAESGSSSGGGGSSSSRYNNDIDVKEGNTFGTVTVSPKTANKGEEVTITVVPKDGFKVDEVTVKDDDGNKVDVEKVSNTEYTFIHPGKATDIYVTYVKTEDTEKPETAQPDTFPFDDVPEGAWYRKAAEYAYEKGIISGTGENTFSPNTNTTRGMIAAILWRLEGSPKTDYAMTFTDVDDSMYYFDAVRWAVSNGIVSGYDSNTFGGNSNITREQFAVMLYNYAKYKGYDVSVGENTNILSYTDASSISEYAYEAMQWACGEGIINGMGNGTLAPQDSATRAEAAQMIMVFCEKFN